MLEKYFYKYDKGRDRQAVKPTMEKDIVIPKLILHDDRKVITTLEEQKILETCMPAHSLSSYARKVTALLLPKVDISFDILLWSRKELTHGEQLLPSDSINKV